MEKFVLPEYWAVRATTRKEDQVLTDYIRTEFGTDCEYDIQVNGTCWFSNIKFKDEYYAFLDNPPLDRTEITYKEFKKYILNKEPIFQQPEDNTELNQILIKLLTE